MNKIILLTVVILSSGSLFSQWHQQNSGTSGSLRSVYFANKSTGWICGLDIVLKTTDCGNSWNLNMLEGNHKSLFFLNENTGWICGENGRIYKTINGGVSWTLLSSGVSTTLNQITFSDQNTGIVSGSNNVILKTTDSGVTWYNINGYSTSLDFLAVEIPEDGHYVVTGTESSIFTSSNSGASWDTISLGMPNPLMTVEFIDSSTGWVSGCCGMFMKTTNGGMSWSKEVYLTPGFSINSVKFINELSGWTTGDAGYILRTTDGGNKWDSLYSSTTAGLYSSFFLNSDTGFVVGYNGLILRTTNGGGTGYPLNIVRTSNEIPERITLLQNYPNPFNPVTVIRYSLNGNQEVSLKVFDVIGKEVATLVNQIQNAGSYEVDFDGSGLSGGIYFYRLAAEDYTDTKRMVLLK